MCNIVLTELELIMGQVGVKSAGIANARGTGVT